MPTPTKGPRLGGGPAHERLMLAGLATALLAHDRITTTEAKAKRLRPLAERLVTFAKRGDLHAPMAVIELVREPLSPKQATVKEAEAATQRAARDAATVADQAAPAAVAEPEAAEAQAEPDDAQVQDADIEDAAVEQVDDGVAGDPEEAPDLGPDDAEFPNPDVAEDADEEPEPRP